MATNFDFGALLKDNEKKHKRKPPQFVSVASGVQKRLQTSLKNRKSNRCTIFDRIRDISECESPQPGPVLSEAQLKVEHRRQQLERWKADKERKKKDEKAQKKKPFVAGIARAPLKYVPPPPLPKPSTSGRVTRSQSAKANSVQPKSHCGSRTLQSFAPKNAPFRAPELKTVTKLPILAPPLKSNNKKPVNITFEPIMPKVANTVKQTRSRTAAINRQTAVESSMNRIKSQTEPKNLKSKINIKSVPVTNPRATRTNKKSIFEQSSSSGSDIAPSDIKKRIKTPGPTKYVKEKKSLTPKVLHLESKTSDEKSSSEEKSVKRKSVRKTIEISSADENLNSESTSSVEDLGTIRKPSRKSLPNNFSPTVLSKTSKDSSDSCNSSIVEFISEEAGTIKTPMKSLSTPKNKKIPKSESGSEEKLRSPKSPIELPLTPEQIEVAKKISPCVTLSRGKDNARKEMKWKMNEGLLDDDTCEGDSIEHFRYQLASETDRMTAKCVEWDKILEQAADQMPEAVQELALAAVGQARLLMSQKMQQFRSLVDRCARPEPGSALVTPADLRGFWDMVFMQVENVDMRFKKLEELQARNWIEDKPVEIKKKAIPKAGVKKTAKLAGNSRLRDMIAAARKAKKDQDTQPSEPTELVPPSESQKTFEAGFFCVRSPVKSPGSASATPRKENNLLKAVLSSEAKKSASKQSTSFAMLRASIFSKNVDCDGVAPLQQTPQLTPINLYATPGRSILKSNNVPSAKKSGKKSIKLVLFNESDADLSFLSLVSEKPDSARDNKTDEISIAGIESRDALLVSGVSLLDAEKLAENKENKSKVKLVRQDAIESETTDERSPIMTRQRRKSMQTPKETTENVEVENKVKSTKRSTRKKKSNVDEDAKEVRSKTPKKSMTEVDVEVKTKSKTPRRRKNVNNKTTQDTKEENSTTKRSTRTKALQELEVNILEASVTPKRSARTRRSDIEMLTSELD